MERFVSADNSGKRSERPRFKGKGRYRSLTFTQMKQTCISGNRITLPKLGSIKLVLHRPIPFGFAVAYGGKPVSCSAVSPEGFKIKTATIALKADGWYVSLSLEDVTVPVLSPNFNTDNAVGVDMGLSSFLVTSQGETVPIPQFAFEE